MNLVIGDVIEFKLPQFEGGSFYSYGRRRGGSKGRYVGDREYKGTIEKDWYDVNDRHWFSVRLSDSRKLKRVQGKNLYPNVTKHVASEQHADAAINKKLKKGMGLIR